MENNKIYDVIKNGECIAGGTYEAYAKVRDILTNCYDGGYKLVSLTNKVNMAEFLEAIKILMAFTSNHPDERVELYYCDSSCKHFKVKPCPGDCMLSPKAINRCPFYEE